MQVNDLSVHITQHSTTAPAVVFEAGAGETSATWYPLIKTLAHHASLYTYDRRGLGHSAPARAPRSLPAMVDDLHWLLQALHVAPPYILIGHSLGGLIVYHYAQHYPERVAGLMLLDAPHPRQITHLSRVLTPYRAIPVVQDLYTALTTSDPATHPEGIDFGASLTLVDYGPALPAVPLTVICRGRSIRTDIPELPLAIANTLDAVWQALQQDLAQRTPRGRFLVAHQSGHSIHEDASHIVTTAIMDMIASVRYA